MKAVIFTVGFVVGFYAGVAAKMTEESMFDYQQANSL